jgi:hypothetical protein
LAFLSAGAATTLTIAALNNPDMIELKKLAPAFEQQNPDIKLNWVVLEENVLRQRVTTDIATNSGKFDVMMIGTYEAPIWAKKGWLYPMDKLSADYDLNDVVKTARDGLSYGGKLYALPFYVESSMTFYRKDLFSKLGLTMPEKPTYTQIADYAKALKEKGGVYGICLRGKAGWGENMAFLSTLINTNGGRWFDENGTPPSTARNGKSRSASMWTCCKNTARRCQHQRLQRKPDPVCQRQVRHVDRCHRGGRHAVQPQGIASGRQGGLCHGPHRRNAQGQQLVVVVVAGHSQVVQAGSRRQAVCAMGHLQGLHQAGGQGPGLDFCSAGHPHLHLQAAGIPEGRPFASFVLNAIQSANPTDATLKKCRIAASSLLAFRSSSPSAPWWVSPSPAHWLATPPWMRH